MKPRWIIPCASLALLGWMASARSAEDSTLTRLQLENGRPQVEFTPAPAAVAYRMYHGPTPSGPFQEVVDGRFDLFRWQGPAAPGESGFFRLGVEQLSREQTAAINLLHRVAYGPTPDDLVLLRQPGELDRYLAAQLAPETLAEDLDTPPPFAPEWRKVTVTGTGSSSVLYLYLDGVGEAVVDNFRLVEGASDNGSQPNLIRNGDFEADLAGSWVTGDTLATSARTADFAQSGGASLRVIDTASGSGKSLATSISQSLTTTLSSSRTYTLSYWYRTAPVGRSVILRLSGSGISSTTSLNPAGPTPSGIFPELVAGTADITDLRAWHVLKAVQSRRQLNEVLRQFLENHFVTEYSKSRDYFDGIGYPNEVAHLPAVQVEFQENLRWQQALLRPQVTFLDLLRISAESPAMIIYLDTVNSRGDAGRIANENYARELCELFCFGVDNGYDQGDIVQISRIWTGWSTELLAPGQESNPFASRSTVYKDPASTNRTALTNLVGSWALRYRNTRHDTRAKYVFYEKNTNGLPITTQPRKVPARFGAPWAGRPYGLALTGGGNGTNTLQEGYRLLEHMANQPFTQEYLAVKLCRLFIHDDFQTGYDFTDADATPEEQLVRACMLAWENPPNGGPRGQLRPVLQVILGSDLFRSQGAALHKVKTPLEYAVSTVRAFRARRPDGSFTAETDGYGLYDVMNRSGRMRLFDRAEPDGYPESGAPWISAGTLAERARFVQAAVSAPANRPGDAGTRTILQPVALLTSRVTAGLNDPGVVADFFLDLLFPGEGRANLAPYRALAVEFLDTADATATASPFNRLTPGTAAYDNRVRALVAFLLTTPRFAEQ